ncbi:MAG: SDR family NAD(P)-dependent oxidoreductase [Pseudomonadales bacterium]
MSRKVAFITGASRGIGKAAALALASKGYDIVITARTMEEGEQHEHGAESSNVRAISGSLTTTAKEIEALGQQALPIRLDLLDTDSIHRAVDQTLDQWGHIDLLLNNGIYQGPGTMNFALDINQVDIQKLYQGNVFSQLLLVQRCLPAMLERNRGCIINMVSESGMIDPPAPSGKGGWGFAYSSSKAALIRMVGVLRAEHKSSSVRFHNVEPGFIVTEMLREQGMVDEFAAKYGGAPPEVPAAVVAWLATESEAREFHGETLFAQRHCRKLNLVPEWQPKR